MELEVDFWVLKIFSINIWLGGLSFLILHSLFWRGSVLRGLRKGPRVLAFSAGKKFFEWV